MSIGPFWKDSLRPASYRGIPFGVTASDGKNGRRNAVHEYPYRDDVWVEDLGKSARRINVTGFLVGDDVIAQRDQMITAVETPGSATLIHPTLGQIDISLLDFDWRERWDLGRVVEITFHFVLSGKVKYPQAIIDTTSKVSSTALTANSATSQAWNAKSSLYLPAGISAVAQQLKTVQTWAVLAQQAVNNATSLFHLAQTLSGPYGRYFGLAGSIVSSMQALIAKATQSRQSTKTAIILAEASAAALSVTNAAAHPSTIQAIASSVLTASANSRDAINSMATLSNMPGGASMAGISGDLMRRSAAIAMATASSQYVPVSYDDAVNIRTYVTSFLDAEILTAADQSEDDTYQALRELRTAVIQDLTTRGGTLANLVDVKSNYPVPALVLAQKLYQDPSRSDELISEANPVHPLFMPTSFKALSS